MNKFSKKISSKKIPNSIEEIIYNKVLQGEIESMLLENPSLFEQSNLKDIRIKAVIRLKHRVEQEEEFLVSVDHTPTLLKEARKKAKNNDVELASLFYSLYFEHKINKIIANIASKRRIAEHSYHQLIKKTNIADKCSWVMEILGKEKILESHIKVINNIAEIRNSYVHYKWKPLDTWSRDSKKIARAKNLEKTNNKLIIQDVLKTISYLNKFEDRIIFNGNKKKIISTIKEKF